jgi:hypothetical protein
VNTSSAPEETIRRCQSLFVEIAYQPFRRCSVVHSQDLQILAVNGTLEKRNVPDDQGQQDDEVAAAARCPVLDCGSLVLEVRRAESLPIGHLQDWRFTCSRCGIEFAVTQGDFIFEAIPKRWFSAYAHSV